MPIFRYKGYRGDGSQAAGTIEADGLRDAISAIKSRGIYPKDVSEREADEKKKLSARRDSSLLPYITRQMATLLSAGVPLVDALRSLSDESRGAWKGILVGVREQVSAGASLARALEAQGKIFPEFYINMVAAGEQSGSLDRILVRVADFLEQQSVIKGKVRAAMIYPAFMAAVGFIVLSFLFTFVIPKIVRIFENSKSALPFATKVLIFISNLFVNYWWAIAAGLVILMLVSRKLKESHMPLLDRWKLKLPGGVIQSLYYGRFARTLGFLLDGGLPMLRALELSSKSVGNTVLGGKIKEAEEKVAEGGRLSGSLEGFPAVLLQLIATGEKSGTLVDILGKAADSYEEEFERRVQRMLALLEPSMILIMGLVVGFIVMAILLPMFELNQLVK